MTDLSVDTPPLLVSEPLVSEPLVSEPDAADLAALRRGGETLNQRLARLARASSLPELPPVLVDRLLAPWARAYARGDVNALRARLSWDATSPELAALAFADLALEEDDPSSAPAPVAAEDPISVLMELGLYFDATLDPGSNPPVAALLRDLAAVPFRELWTPWVLGARDRVGAVDPGLLSAAALEQLLVQLARDLGALGERAAYELFAAERDAAEVPSGVYQRFIRHLLTSGLVPLYREFPVLLRQMATCTAQWVAATRELLTRLAADRDALAARFGAPGAPLGSVAEVLALAADRHRGGRRVLGLRFAGGVRVVYKPRSVALEAVWANLLAWATAHGLTAAPPAADVLACDGYGWCAWIVSAPPPSIPELYRQAGVLACFAHALRGRDLHAENLIAAAHGPVLIDAEMLFQPTLAGQRDDVAGSCLATGLFAAPGVGAGAGGLRAMPPRLLSERSRRWRGHGGDDLLLDAGELWSAAGDNVPLVDGEPVGPEGYLDELLAGFAEGYRFLVAQRDGLLAPGGPLASAAEASVRILFRPSQQYANVLALLTAPRHQRRGVDASLLLEPLVAAAAGATERPGLWPLVADERADLESLDVPYVTLPAAATAIPTTSGTPVTGHFSRSGWEATRERLLGLSASDLERQLALVRQALTPVAAPLPALVTVPAETPFCELALATARAIGEHLLAHPSPPAVVGERADPRRASLYGGAVGEALFLAALARRTADDRFAAAAQRRLLPLATARPGAEWSLGGFNGVGSVVWAGVAVSRLLDAPEPLALARQWAAAIDSEAIAADRASDVVAGAAGALLALLALHQATGDEQALARATDCGEHLLRRQVVVSSWGAAWRAANGLPLAGFAHGAAGIARALSALAVVTADDRFAVAALAGLGYERSLFDERRGNWPVLANDGMAAPTWMTAWCHGAPGVGLGRLGLAGVLRDATVDGEIAAAMRTTATARLAATDHLCCGSFGRAAALRLAGQGLDRLEWLASAQELAARSLAACRESGAFRLTPPPGAGAPPPAGRPATGLMRGLAGIGYELLSLAAVALPRTGDVAPLPAVLLLELPLETLARQRPEVSSA
jgi:lantibiotic modifying enzyme